MQTACKAHKLKPPTCNGCPPWMAELYENDPARLATAQHVRPAGT